MKTSQIRNIWQRKSFNFCVSSFKKSVYTLHIESFTRNTFVYLIKNGVHDIKQENGREFRPKLTSDS